MYETLNIVLGPEVLLSIAVLSLVLYGINLSTLKISAGVICMAGIIIGADYFNLGYVMITNCWVVTCKFIIVIGSISILLMSVGEEIIVRPTQSAPILVLIVALSSLLLVSSINWFSIYLAIELQTLTLFILVALKRDSAYSTEASLKYFVLGAVSSGLFLFGCVLLYGLTGTTSVQEINSNLTADIGKILVTISLLFKLSVVPFHMWAPDVYEGSPTVVTALLATVPKIGVFSILVQVGPVTNVVILCAVLSIVYGAVGALNQTKVKRLLAYSGIGHMGFILFGLGLGSFESIQAGLIYMIIYVIMSICSFSILLSLNLTKDFIIEVRELSRKTPVVAFTLAFIFLSTAGIPPLAGFLSKWLVLLSGVSSGYYLICSIIVVSSVIAGVYYVRVVQIIYFQVENSVLIWQRIFKKERAMELSKSLLIGFTFFIILFLMVSPNCLLQITHDATISLY
uniref:NADH:ubiquinone reductase (H(+)-translocating) n=1 Tax=Cinachyrella kuekenthali TaxID=458489 RepID=I6LIF6_9METZ|nr:NADH dehydrogenase subunit 2 [Cinachyrella kuekenthali]ABW83837.1 NADH dehydrogenase subunit 2 [Cinachyrella kuekenthali]